MKNFFHLNKHYYIIGDVAQSVVHRAYKQNTYTQSNAKVVGSIPTVSIFSLNLPSLSDIQKKSN